MQLSYYPGCTLHGTSEEYDQSIRAVCRALDVTLNELDDWTCCGASSAHAQSDKLANLLAARNLVLAGRKGKDVMVPCAACFSRLKFAEKAMSGELGEWTGTEDSKKDLKVLHIHDFLADPVLLEAMSEKVLRPLKGLKVVPYYGCLTVRPPKIVDAKDPENPVALDRVLKVLSADVVPWSFKTDCCGGSFALSKPEVVRKLSGDLMAAAKKSGADCFVTDCPMCQANLDSRQKEIEAQTHTDYKMPIFFITELIAIALGLPGIDQWLSKHLVDPKPVLKMRGLL